MPQSNARERQICPLAATVLGHTIRDETTSRGTSLHPYFNPVKPWPRVARARWPHSVVSPVGVRQGFVVARGLAGDASEDGRSYGERGEKT
jgi:hypothetical protein